MTLYALLLAPFNDYAFMRRALVACIAIAISGAPLGVFMVLRRMTLAGDAISHAILPGAAIAFLCYGFSLPMMAAGGLIAGLIIAVLAGLVTQFTLVKEDASFTGFYLISLAAGVLIISLHGNSIDVLHVLFGNVLAIDKPSLLLVCGIASICSLLLAAFYRLLVVQCFDPAFLRNASRHSGWLNILFLCLIVLNLVAAFQALGTLMALSIIVLPAIASRLWAASMEGSIAFSILVSIGSSYAGLLLSYHANLPTSPSIVIAAGSIYLFSLLVGRYGSLRTRFAHKKHYAS